MKNYFKLGLALLLQALTFSCKQSDADTEENGVMATDSTNILSPSAARKNKKATASSSVPPFSSSRWSRWPKPLLPSKTVWLNTAIYNLHQPSVPHCVQRPNQVQPRQHESRFEKAIDTKGSKLRDISKAEEQLQQAGLKRRKQTQQPRPEWPSQL